MDVDAKQCKLQVWDTAGQDRFKCVVSSFYRGAHGVMICFDITDLDSFRNVDNWFDEVKRYCPEQTPVFLVGTKSDLQSKRMVSYQAIKAYTESKNLTYIETSSKSNENIENCFTSFTRILVEHTNQKELSLKKEASRNPTVVVNPKNRPITDSGCMGRNQCII